MQIIIEGIDHCGKDTLIDSLQSEFGGITLHSVKPKFSPFYFTSPDFKSSTDRLLSKRFLDVQEYEDDPLNNPYVKPYTTEEMQELAFNCAKYAYQCEYFNVCFKTMFTYRDWLNTNVYYNRFHLGEYVYGKLYRNYDSYMQNRVFEIEDKILFEDKETDTTDWLHLFLLCMHKPSIRKIDNEAFSNTSGHEEQELFIEAFNKSKIAKSIIFVDTPDGVWRDKKDIYNEVKNIIKPNM